MRTLFPLLLGITAMADDSVFSHKRHAAVELKCTFCHQGADTKMRAGFPDAKSCAVCHPGKPAPAAIPSTRVYKLADFVFFSHARHAEGKVECATCHGQVKTQDRIELFRSTKMPACVECHKQTKATVVCNACHELGQ